MLILLRQSARGCESSAFELESLSHRDTSGRLDRVSLSTDMSHRYITYLQRSNDLGQTAKTTLQLIHPLVQLVALEIKEHFYTSSARWEDDEVISLLQTPEAAKELKALDYDFRANLYRVSLNMDIHALRETITAIKNAGPLLQSKTLVRVVFRPPSPLS